MPAPSAPSPEPKRAVRIPLATGATAKTLLLFGLLSLVGSLFSLALLIPLSRVERSADPGQKLIWLVPIMFFLASLYFHFQALRSRASDAILGPAGLRIEGGPHDGLQLAWPDLRSDGCRLETNHNAYVQSGNQRTYQQQLILRLSSGQDVAVASSFDATEQDSFSAFLTTLQALAPAEAPPPPHPPTPASAQSLVCQGCGAAAVPVEAPTSLCSFCGHSTPMPDDVRERVQRARQASRARLRGTARLKWLLSRPQAQSTNRWLLAVLLAKYLMPVVLLLQARLWLTAIALVWVLGRVLQLKLAARQVLQALILDYAAVPATAGQPLRCRRCDGALPAAEATHLVQSCAFCQAENLTGIDVHQQARAAERRAAELAAALQQERLEHLRGLALICAGLLLAIYGLYYGYAAH